MVTTGFRHRATAAVTARAVVLMVLALLVILPGLPVLAAELTARVDRDTLVEGETVTLIIQTDDPEQSLNADLGALAGLFTVLDQRSETQMSIVNGRQSAVTRLVLTLEPQRSGELRIPPLQFGGSATPPLTLTVNPAPEPEPGEAPAVFIEVEVEPAAGPHYVHAQLRLTVRVFYQQNLTEAAITPPEPSQASVRLLDEVPYQADRGGNRYRVLERHYAVFPERSGPLVIPAMQLSGRLVERRSDRLWQPAVRGRRVEVSSDPIELQIVPRPAEFTGTQWLPARSLALSQNISAGDELVVGEPVTRTVIIDAVGLEENMLTEPEWAAMADARIYPDRPQGITRDDGRWMLGHKEFRYAVVPERAGELVLPALEVHWWDTVNDRQQVAVLPAQRLQVQPSSVVPPPAPVAASVPAEQGSAAPFASPFGSDRPAGYWMWLTALFAALWLITLGLYFRRPRLPQKASAAAESVPAQGAKALLADFRRACAEGSPADARLALIHWLRAYGPPDADGSLLRLADTVRHEALRRALLALDARGFRPTGADDSFDGAALAAAFAEWHGQWQRAQRHQAPAATDLYAVVPPQR